MVSSSAVPPHTEQHFHRQLIEALVAEPAPALLPEPRNQRLNVRVRVPLTRALAQDQIRPHAASRKVAHAIVILRPVGMGVEMTRAVVADVLEELDQKEGGLR